MATLWHLHYKFTIPTEGAFLFILSNNPHQYNEQATFIIRLADLCCLVPLKRKSS